MQCAAWLLDVLVLPALVAGIDVVQQATRFTEADLVEAGLSVESRVVPEGSVPDLVVTVENHGRQPVQALEISPSPVVSPAWLKLLVQRDGLPLGRLGIAENYTRPATDRIAPGSTISARLRLQNWYGRSQLVEPGHYALYGLCVFEQEEKGSPLAVGAVALACWSVDNSGHTPGDLRRTNAHACSPSSGVSLSWAWKSASGTPWSESMIEFVLQNNGETAVWTPELTLPWADQSGLHVLLVRDSWSTWEYSRVRANTKSAAPVVLPPGTTVAGAIHMRDIVGAATLLNGAPTCMVGLYTLDIVESDGTPRLQVPVPLPLVVPRPEGAGYLSRGDTVVPAGGPIRGAQPAAQVQSGQVQNIARPPDRPLAE